MNTEDQTIEDNLEIGGQNLRIQIISKTQRLLSVGIVERLGTIKISARKLQKAKK